MVTNPIDPKAPGVISGITPTTSTSNQPTTRMRKEDPFGGDDDGGDDGDDGSDGGDDGTDGGIMSLDPSLTDTTDDNNDTDSDNSSSSDKKTDSTSTDTTSTTTDSTSTSTDNSTTTSTSSTSTSTDNSSTSTSTTDTATSISVDPGNGQAPIEVPTPPDGNPTATSSATTNDAGDPDTSIVFTDDDLQMISDQYDDMVNQNAKAQCSELAAEATNNANNLHALAEGLAVTTAAVPPLVTTAAYAYFGSWVQSQLAKASTDCANDPPRSDTNVVTMFSEQPYEGLPAASTPLDLALRSVVMDTGWAVEAIEALTISIERLQGAVAQYNQVTKIKKASQAAITAVGKNLLNQAGAVTHNSLMANQHLTNLQTAITNATKLWAQTHAATAGIAKASATAMVNASKLAWQKEGANLAKIMRISAADMTAIQAAVTAQETAVAKGTTTPAQLAAQATAGLKAVAAPVVGAALQGIGAGYLNAVKPTPVGGTGWGSVSSAI